jgi:hypothetical protein
MRTRREAESPADLGVKVGDYFVSSWGYDQTNVDFYKVVAVTAKSIKVQEWSSARVSGAGGPTEGVVPGEGPATYVDWSACTPDMDHWERDAAKVVRPKEVRLRRVWSSGSQACFTVNSYSNAYHWDGKPEQQTGTGWGH